MSTANNIPRMAGTARFDAAAEVGDAFPPAVVVENDVD
jgi:hypothetical protein